MNGEGYMSATQLHLFKVVVSQCLMASESLAPMDEDQGAQRCDHYWAGRYTDTIRER